MERIIIPKVFDGDRFQPQYFPDNTEFAHPTDKDLFFCFKKWVHNSYTLCLCTKKDFLGVWTRTVIIVRHYDAFYNISLLSWFDISTKMNSLMRTYE